MALLEKGRVCVITQGRDAGKKVVIEEVGKDFVTVEGDSVKKKKCSLKHIFPTKETKKG